jgi:hypothetical protein
MTDVDVVTDGADQYRRRVRPDESVSEAVVDLVAEVEGTDALELDPIGRRIDADAVERLFGPNHGQDLGGERSIRFRYQGYTVTISGNGTERVCSVANV